MYILILFSIFIVFVFTGCSVGVEYEIITKKHLHSIYSENDLLIAIDIDGDSLIIDESFYLLNHELYFKNSKVNNEEIKQTTSYIYKGTKNIVEIILTKEEIPYITNLLELKNDLNNEMISIHIDMLYFEIKDISIPKKIDKDSYSIEYNKILISSHDMKEFFMTEEFIIISVSYIYKQKIKINYIKINKEEIF